MTDKSNYFDPYGTCPVCNTNWDDGSILDTFIEMKRKGHWPDKTEEQIRKEVAIFTMSPRKWSALTIKKIDNNHSLFQCPGCECEFLTRSYKGHYYLKTKDEETK